MKSASGPQRQWRRALITGASSGIGEAIARRLAAEHVDLVLVARRRDRLEALSSELGTACEVLVADLAQPEQLETVADRLRSTTSPVDLLVNNAGFGAVGDFLETEASSETGMLDVNVGAVHLLSRAAGSAMVQRGSGAILNVSSIAGFAPTPRSATYGATKAFVTSLSESLHIELGPQGVVVTCVCPGLTETEFHQRAGYRPDGVPARTWQTADEVAQAALEGLAAGKAVVVPGRQNKAAVAAARLAPTRLVRRAANRLATLNNK